MYNSLTRPWGIRLKIVWSFMTLFVEHADWMLFEFEQILLSFANSKPAKDNTCSSCVKYLKKLKLAWNAPAKNIACFFSLVFKTHSSITDSKVRSIFSRHKYPASQNLYHWGKTLTEEWKHSNSAMLTLSPFSLTNCRMQPLFRTHPYF